MESTSPTLPRLPGLSRLIAALMLIGGLAACDPPVAEQGRSASAAAVSQRDAIQAQAIAAEAAQSPAIAQADPFATALQGAAQDVRTKPRADALTITPMEYAGRSDGNALLSVRFSADSRAPDVVEYRIDERVVVLRRDPKDRTRHTGMLHFDFDEFAREQQRRRDEMSVRRNASTPRFRGREAVSAQPLTFVDPQALRIARRDSTPISITQATIAAVDPNSVDPTRQLMIVDTAVVEDPLRTFDSCANVGTRNGAWTFGRLMRNIVNTQMTGIDPALYTEEWMNTWKTDQMPNGFFPAPARPNIATKVLAGWPRLSNGRLNLDVAPMRLLAIVNRLDLRGPRSDMNGSLGEAGEGRFIFGVLDRSNGRCEALPFTIIFEFRVPVQGCSATLNYAKQWGNLANINIETPEFNTALAAVTNRFARAGADPLGINGNALNQIRTNENALDDLWELREYKQLGDASGNIRLRTFMPGQTPHISKNGTSLLGDYMNRNATAILNGTHLVVGAHNGQPFMGSSAAHPTFRQEGAWRAPNVSSNLVRHKFGLETCNGCHGAETATGFLHIEPRERGDMSRMSEFLQGLGTPGMPTTVNIADPVVPTTFRTFGELQRRRADLANLLASSCTTTAVFSQILDQPVHQVH